MNRILSLLLIPLFMLGHILPHSHAGVGVDEAHGDAYRPHIHVSSGHHDGHNHHAAGEHHHAGDHTAPESAPASATLVLTAPVDHDFGAIYIADTDWTTIRTTAAPTVASVPSVWGSLAFSLDLDSCSIGRWDEPVDHYGRLPIYLLTASLRL
ncbi:hypothetical protein FF011L_11650 [Roseimaritima multifibrata]|uniref:Uncharacterized protein n=1 Tax=Roseimaritima multifibrata TaxID=1930274 RepID=A0A517MC19_9BACT|nr:hypothetical protein [Roseimaritima multifibrata]QDS92422.1 hypothetical protein FF011L_11650 [Roseimaritima multifibrata]